MVKFVTVVPRHHSIHALQSFMDETFEPGSHDLSDLNFPERELWIMEAAACLQLGYCFGHVTFKTMAPMFGLNRLRMDVTGVGLTAEAFVLSFRE